MLCVTHWPGWPLTKLLHYTSLQSNTRGLRGEADSWNPNPTRKRQLPCLTCKTRAFKPHCCICWPDLWTYSWTLCRNFCINFFWDLELDLKIAELGRNPLAPGLRWIAKKKAFLCPGPCTADPARPPTLQDGHSMCRGKTSRVRFIPRSLPYNTSRITCVTQQTIRALKVTNKLINYDSVNSLNCSTSSFLLTGKLLLKLLLAEVSSYSVSSSKMMKQGET